MFACSSIKLRLIFWSEFFLMLDFALILSCIFFSCFARRCLPHKNKTIFKFKTKYNADYKKYLWKTIDWFTTTYAKREHVRNVAAVVSYSLQKLRNGITLYSNRSISAWFNLTELKEFLQNWTLFVICATYRLRTVSKNWNWIPILFITQACLHL